MDELDEWRRHLGMPVDVELENPYGEKFKVKMKPLTGESYIDLSILGNKIDEELSKLKGDSNEKVGRVIFTKENSTEVMRLLKLCIVDVPEEIKDELAGRYIHELYAPLFNIHNQTTKTIDVKGALEKTQLQRKRMEELRKNDGKSPEDTQK